MKLLLVIDVDDGVEGKYDWLSIDYNLHGINTGVCDDIIKCVKCAKAKPLPDKWFEDGSTSFAMGIARGFNKCIEEIEK